MGKLDQFFIELANESAVFYAGAMIEGRVVVFLNEGMKMRNLRILFHGHAKNHWTEHRSTGAGENRKSETIHYGAEEDYVRVEVILWGQGGGADGVMPAGQHQFPFQFQLPPLCPTSFEGSNGRVRYSCKATIDKPWKFDHTTKRAFTVIGLQDLNIDGNARLPVNIQQAKTLGVGCCKNGEISATCRIAKTGFVPGEIMQAAIDVSNQSNSRKIKRVEVKVEAVPSGMSTSMDLRAPFIVGTVPLREMFSVRLFRQWFRAFTPGPAGPPQPGFIGGETPTIPGTAPTAPPPPPTGELYPDMPPPSYGECVFGKTSILDNDDGDNQYTRGDNQFAPRYAYYNFPQPTAPPQ